MSALGRLARSMVPGLRQVHAQVAHYAAEWEEANGRARSGHGSLWVVLGDSTAQGIGAPAWDEGYVGQLLRALDAGSQGRWRVVNLSRSGARAADVLDRQLPALEGLAGHGVPATQAGHGVPATQAGHGVPATQAGRPDLVTCAIGANDIVRRTPLPVLADQLRRILGRLPPGAVMATLPQGLNASRTDAANRVIREEAPRAGVLVADVWARTGPPWRGKFAADNFHPGALGYADWAAAFADVLPAALWPGRSDPS
jgi:lysophospholipase L1-like esterase